MSNPQVVNEHYGVESLQAHVAEALQTAGLGEGVIDWKILSPLDQFHVRGLAATRELADALDVHTSETLIDVGCGLGGSARFLAANYGCQVTGIDLSQPFVDVAQMLTRRTGLTDRVTCRQADALNLPFADASFDLAWTQHVAMNIANRSGLYESIHRVLKPGGRLAIYDVIVGDGGPLTFPVPWARVPQNSFLLSADAMLDALEEAGFIKVSWVDKSDLGLAWFADLPAKALPPATPLGIHIVMGPEFAEMSHNLGRNLQAGRVRLVQAIVEKAVAIQRRS